MLNKYRAALLAVSLAAGCAMAGGSASAAVVGPFSPLQAATAVEGGGVELATYGHHHWGRRCWRDCYRGYYGRLHCTWRCYRPRRWW
jgi:hypothetical protein